MAYRIMGRKCGAIRFNPDTGTIDKESRTMSSKMTSYALETGSTVSDHVYKNPEQVQLGGILIGGMDELIRLRQMWECRDLVSYEGRIRVDNMVIINLQEGTATSNLHGGSFTATLQRATMVSSSYVEVSKIMLMSEADGDRGGQQAPVKNAGVQPVASQQVSENAYEKYVASYNGKSSSGPGQRKTASYNGVRS